MSSVATSPALRSSVLSWYRKCLRAGERWPGAGEERLYIANETRTLFRRNAALRLTPAQIKRKLFEAESRYELAHFYKIPYPRPFHAPRDTPPSLLSTTKLTSTYMDSYDEHTPEHTPTQKEPSKQPNLHDL